MGYWISDKYFYTRSELQYIAENYKDYLDPIVGGVNFNPTGSFRLYDINSEKLSKKIDFDRALNAIGRGYWSGTHFGNNEKDIKFKTYRAFSGRQQVVIADILGIAGWELERLGFYNIDKFRKLAYIGMIKFLNGVDTKRLDK